MSDHDRPRFAGWHRESSSSPWRQYVEADTVAECWQMLSAQAGPGDLTVTPQGRSPEPKAGKLVSGLNRARTLLEDARPPVEAAKRLEPKECDQRPGESLTAWVNRLEAMDLSEYTEDARAIRSVRLYFARQELADQGRSKEIQPRSDKQTRVLRLPKLPPLVRTTPLLPPAVNEK